MWSWSFSKDSLRLPHSKSRTILRVISTTFRSPSPPPSASPPPANISLQAKQNREAALRERGLLPPKPSKDLSRQEADRDHRIPIVPLDQNSSDDPAEPSAADLVKKEWEARNSTAKSVASAEIEERERMKSFRFGAVPGSPSQKTTDFYRLTQLETVVEAKSSPPSPLHDGTTVPPAVPAKDPPRKASSPRSSASAEQRLFGLPATPLPTPPPTPSKPNASQKLVSISSAADPPSTSFQFTRHGQIDAASSSSHHNFSGFRRSPSSAPPPTNPVISLTPSGHINSYGQSSSTPSFTASNPQRRSGSLTQMTSISESSSLMTPSLDNSSGSPTTISTLNTIVSSSAVSSTVGPKGRSGLLKAKAPEHVRTIPMIIESPVEDCTSTGREVTPERVPQPFSPVSQTQSPTLAVPPQNPTLTRRGRGFTETEKREKRKFFNPFKRSQPSGLDESDGSQRRISVSSSFGNLRRVANNWTRPRSSYAASMTPSNLSGKAKTFDASQLPASPMLPNHFASSGAGPNATGVGLTPPSRKALHPTLHNRASILHEMNRIKDDEVRRMTEVAFLG